MSYALSTYLVSAEAINRFPGCDDDSLLFECLASATDRLEDYDEQMLDEDDEDAITHEQAFRELFSGTFSAPYHGGTYGWAFEVLCDCLGTWLSNSGFSPCNGSWYDQLDEHLAAAGAALRFSELLYACPIKIPMPDDWPLIGHWPGDRLIEAAPVIAGLAASATDHEVAEAFATVEEWCKAAARNPGCMLIGFHG